VIPQVNLLKQSQTILSAPSPSFDTDTDEVFLSDAADASEVETRTLDIPSSLNGERLDRALVTLLPEFSRSFLQQMLTEGCVAQLGVAARVMSKSSSKVRMGERYEVTLRPTPQSQAFTPEAMDLDVVYQDEDLQVIVKPAGLVVHPAPGNWGGTLLNGLLAMDEKAVLLPRAGIVHRLDKDTSGLMVVARSRRAMDALIAMIAARDVHREYLAVGYHAWHGEWVKEVEVPIGRDYRNRLRMAVVDLDRTPGKTAHTTLSCLSSTDEACLVHCTLHTGRTHQIRVHMAHLSHPLLGDATYGGPMTMGIERQALHAFRLSFEHPFTGKLLAFEAPLPQDMQKLLQTQDLSLDLPE
jgi:23S rRNA pseudouridine1911/1915/1917 synthase